MAKMRSRRYKKQNRRRRTQRKKRAGNGKKSDIICCMCEQKIGNKTVFQPLKCLKTHGHKAHHICEKCWWDPEHGFAREDAPHGCPGCAKHIPLVSPKKRSPKGEVIVISDSEDEDDIDKKYNK